MAMMTRIKASPAGETELLARASSRGVSVHPPFALDKCPDAITNVIANLSDIGHRPSLGVLERPVVTSQARNERALLPAAHCDKEVRPFDELRRE